MFIKVVGKYDGEYLIINPDHIECLTYDEHGEYTCIYLSGDTPLIVQDTPKDIMDKILSQEFLMAKYLEYVKLSNFSMEDVAGHLMANSVGGVSE